MRIISVTPVFHAVKRIQSSDTYSEPCKTSKINVFAKIVDGIQPLTIFRTLKTPLELGHERLFPFLFFYLRPACLTYSCVGNRRQSKSDVGHNNDDDDDDDSAMQILYKVKKLSRRIKISRIPKEIKKCAVLFPY